MGSLGFVGLEFRQNAVAVRSATQPAIADQANDLDFAMATDARLSELAARMMSGAQEPEMTPGDARQLGMAVTSGFRRLENISLQVRNGVLDDDAFSRIGFRFYTRPFSRELWWRVRESFDPDFAAFMDEALRQDIRRTT